jgi:L-rhamnose isomerase
MEKALLYAMLEPSAEFKALQESGNYTKLMVMQEEYKTLPFGEVWEEYCRQCGVPADGEWFATVKAYEDEVLVKRV